MDSDELYDEYSGEIVLQLDDPEDEPAPSSAMGAVLWVLLAAVAGAVAYKAWRVYTRSTEARRIALIDSNDLLEDGDDDEPVALINSTYIE